MKMTRTKSGVELHKQANHLELFTLASARLCNQIMKEGKNLGSGILKVNGFINHKVREEEEVLERKRGKKGERGGERERDVYVCNVCLCM